ncbi:hypothetical protein ABZ863_18890 [Saccharomonospora sp. NPDC046836]|uniref:hypothetical protein n=1 Tax=Saccharomonospora sp. NPDC046836 TaxID=3156921 RepID=UPI0033FDCFEE
MIRRERLRSLQAVVVAALVLPVSACSSGDAAQCEEAFTAAATSVAGVTSAEWDCNFGFGGGWVRGDVVVEAAGEDEAIAVMDAVLRAFAASPDLEDGWSTPQEYATRDRSVIVSAGDVGFNGPPNVGEVREHYGITPG